MRFVEKEDLDSATQGASSDASGRGLASWLIKVAETFGRTGWRGHAVSKKQMSIVETLALGPKKHLILVRCGDECFLVGTGSDSVQTIVALLPEMKRADPKREGI